MKYGLNGTLILGSPPGWAMSTESQFTASRTRKKIQKPRHLCGGLGLCFSGIPRPSGAGATRQPPSSWGIGDEGAPSRLLAVGVPDAGSATALTPGGPGVCALAHGSFPGLELAYAKRLAGPRCGRRQAYSPAGCPPT